MEVRPEYEELTIGVVALQGSFAKHAFSMGKLGIKSRAVREPEDLKLIDALILPGGESTTMSLLLEEEGLWEPMNEVLGTMPVFGTCAGAILLGQQIDDDRVRCFEKIDYKAERNAFGRQIESFKTSLIIPTILDHDFHAIFIRAPKFREIQPNVMSLAVFGADPVLLRQDNILVASFHPELTEDPGIHKYFVDEIVLKSR
ncbi:MAG: pyridoxal 5'-phosphate synthase glutaminase subunit PdxT [Candidatus Marinimicrobia bacterium]|nr:pyridoxal 5'-phosphate synthase glutaminase subunit PdxT [Candidatus Neomarinimicrobiota bacterium]